MVTFIEAKGVWGVDTKEGLKMISREMYNCLIHQYEVMGWKKEVIGTMIKFFPKK